MAKETPEVAEKFTLELTMEQALDDQSCFRIMARDGSKEEKEQDQTLVGSISFNMK